MGLRGSRIAEATLDPPATGVERQRLRVPLAEDRLDVQPQAGVRRCARAVSERIGCSSALVTI
jgi:hypothetical protein